MKKLFFFLTICIYTIGNSQIITFSDVNFKGKLLASNSGNAYAKNSFGNGIIVDTNGDNEIQVSEALNVYELDLWSPFLSTTGDIVSLNGILNFQNLKKLNCFGNSITSLDLQGLANLEYINAGYNDISTINVTGLINLKEVDAYNNQLTNINIDNLSNLIRLNVHDNLLTSINFNNNTSFEILTCYNNSISVFDFSTLSNLRIVSCDNNLLTSINFGTLNQLNELTCSNNLLTNLNISNLSSLTYLDFSSNQIPSITFPSTNAIFSLNVSNNPISTLNLNSLTSINNLNVSNTLITNLDCSQNTVQQLVCSNNPNLLTINVQNNVFTFSDPDLLFFGLMIGNNPQLQSICLDYGEQNNLSFNNYSYNTSGSVIVYSGPTCSTVIPANTFSVSDFKSNNLVLFPNPTRNNLKLMNIASIEIKSIAIHNSIGQLVKKINDFQENIDVSDLINGIYFISVELEKGIVTEKFIKI